ncbi:hypothetical protein [Hirschia maritima]|uniref:hypothetical protein n=1 Tax=Hirschia maritima TaxID=1121961 RepID=UPI00037095F5|nr:hypothetical protein [Hirschia maritima]
MSDIDIHFTNWITNIINTSDDIPLIFVSGAQGIGKSTAMNAICKAFDNQIAILGIDEFYLTKKERMSLAQKVSPLFETRGPPGTHDLDLLNTTITALRSATESSIITIPVFDKKIDDRVHPDEFRTFSGSPKAIIVEGWLVGASAEMTNSPLPPINDVERLPHAKEWQNYQEEQLAGPYKLLWDLSPHFFHLNAPSFETVLQWRIEQEETTLGLAKGTLHDEKRDWVKNFIQYYERLTKRMLNGQKKTGAQLFVDENRAVLKFEDRTIAND